MDQSQARDILLSRIFPAFHSVRRHISPSSRVLIGWTDRRHNLKVTQRAKDKQVEGLKVEPACVSSPIFVSDDTLRCKRRCAGPRLAILHVCNYFSVSIYCLIKRLYNALAL